MVRTHFRFLLSMYLLQHSCFCAGDRKRWEMFTVVTALVVVNKSSNVNICSSDKCLRWFVPLLCRDFLPLPVVSIWQEVTVNVQYKTKGIFKHYQLHIKLYYIKTKITSFGFTYTLLLIRISFRFRMLASMLQMKWKI